MEVNQIYSLLNDTATQVYGAGAISALDVTDIMSLRETVFSAGADKFLNTLVDRIGRTVIRTLDFTSTFPKLIMDEYSFGCILQKIDVQPIDAQSAEYWNVGNVGFTPTLYKIDKSDIRVGFFKHVNAWECDVTIPDTLFKSAFTSASAMDSFISAIFDSMETSINIQLENECRLQIATLIANKVNASNGVVDLLALYNDVASTPIYDADVARMTPDFLKFAGMTMRNYIKYLAKPSTLYNMGDGSANTYVRATSRDNMHVMILTEFASAFTTYLSQTFHSELVELPYYNEVEYWQGTGKVAPNFADCSTIKITLDNDAEHSGANPVTVTQSGVVGLFCDRESIGVGLYDRFSAVDRNNRNRYSNYTNGCTIQSFIDLSENAVVFILVDQTPPTP